MLTTKDVHAKLQEISRKYKSGNPPISIKGLAEEMGVQADDLLLHINTLELLKLVHYDGYKQQITVTELGTYYDTESMITDRGS